MEHSQYHHLPSGAREGADAVVLPVKGCGHIRCLPDQVKQTCALVRDLIEVVKKIQQLGKHGEEASWKIMELEALCKQHAEAAQKLRDERATLEGMVKSHNELIMEIADEIELNHMGEEVDDKVDEEEEEDLVKMVPKQEASEAHEVILADAESQLP
jgi:predicted nuclease with TOPRIM domain